MNHLQREARERRRHGRETAGVQIDIAPREVRHGNRGHGLPYHAIDQLTDAEVDALLAQPDPEDA